MMNRPAKMTQSIMQSSVGPILVTRTPKGISALAFLDSVGEREALADLRRQFRQTEVTPRELLPPGLTKEIKDALRGSANDPPLDLIGTPFQLKVWNALMKIPRGETRTYSDIAKMVGKPRAVRAVATAIGDNPVSLFVPCHRVLRKDGGLGGYRWGCAVKQKLLKLERAAR